MMRLALLGLALGTALPALAQERLAVPSFDFTDGSGEVRDQTAEHAAQLALFNETLRGALEAGGIEVVVPACDGPCSPRNTQLKAMAAAARAVDAPLLLVGRLHKVSTLIGTIRLSVLDIDADKVVCTRSLTYRGDNAEAWTRAAEFTASDLLEACFGERPS